MKALAILLIAFVAISNAQIVRFAIEDSVCCEEGKYLDSDGACQPCAEYCTSCDYANENHSNIETTGCVCGVSHCSSCSAADTCDTCEDGYFLNQTSGACDACSSGCAVCTSASACTTCDDNKFNAGNGTCVAALANCTIMGNNGECTDCDPNYFVDSGSCSACGTNCAECSSASTCTACMAGGPFSSPGTGCQVCPTNCATCSSSSVCLSCNTGYWDTANACSQTCDANSSACNDADGNVTACNSYYQVDTSTDPDSCIACPANAINCDTSTEECDAGYYWDSGNSNCAVCGTNCATCNSTDCLTCTPAEGYQVSGTDCVACGTNCATCASGACVTCNPGFGGMSGQDCPTTCGTGCTACADTTSCDLCGTAGDGLFYKVDSSDGSCTQCPANCNNCSVDATNCTSCNTGFYVSSGSCAACIQYCNTCNDGTTCTQCDSTHYIPDCHDKINSAAECASNEYYDASNFECDPCITGCAACTNGSDCTRCNDGKGYVGGACSNCTNADENLKNCRNDLALITACDDGFIVSSDSMTCIPCIENCTACTVEGECTANSCMDGYETNQDNTKCIACADQCKHCISSCIRGCTECWVGSLAENCQCASGEEYNATEHTCDPIPDPVTDGEMTPEPEVSEESESANILTFTLAILAFLVMML